MDLHATSEITRLEARLKELANEKFANQYNDSYHGSGSWSAVERRIEQETDTIQLRLQELRGSPEASR